jgi:hypothetical protein
MEKRQIRMQDGRYLIFYTFADVPTVARVGDGEPESDEAAEVQPAAKPEAEEEP